MLYRIIEKNENKFFWTIGQFEFKYFGGSDVANKLHNKINFVKKFVDSYVQDS